MGTIDFYGAIHIKRRQTSKEKVLTSNAIAHCELAIKVGKLFHIENKKR